ncbi:3-hydroxyacyl-CoA dehyrogenase [Hyaloscypha variabilis]
MSHNIRTVAVIGAGVIGRSFTALFLAHGLKVLIFVSEPTPASAKKLEDYLQNVWPTIEKQETASIKNYEILSRVNDLETRLKECDFIQENGPEKLDIKISLFGQLDAYASPTAIIASATSGIPSSKFITECKYHPERILIVHPFNPPHVIPLVEIVPHPKTAPEVAERTKEFFSSLGRYPVVVQHEVPGFVANRLQCALLMEAFSLVRRGVVTPEELDATITQGLGLRWSLTGPFMTAILGGGGNPGGFERIANHLGPGLWAWMTDMQAHSVMSEDPAKVFQPMFPVVQDRLGMVDTVALEKERDELLGEIIRLKKERKTLV